MFILAEYFAYPLIVSKRLIDINTEGSLSRISKSLINDQAFAKQ